MSLAVYRREIRLRGRRIAELQAKVGMLNSFMRALLAISGRIPTDHPLVQRVLVMYGHADKASEAHGERLAIEDIRNRLLHAQRQGADVKEALSIVDYVSRYRGPSVSRGTG